MSAVQVISGDFNGDGLADFAILSSTQKYIYISNGAGQFTLYDSYYLGSTPQVTYTMSAVQVISGDFNGDGNSDFAIFSTSQKYIYLSNGNGSFTLYDSYYTGSSPSITFTAGAFNVISGDFNGDGNTDFAILTSTENYVFISNGNSYFNLIDTYYYGGAPNLNFKMGAIQTVVGDFNGDGKTDYAILSSSENYVFLSNGDGTFLLTDTYYEGGAPNLNFTMSQMQAIAGDFNGDGLSDYVLIGPSTEYSFLEKGLPLTELASITNGLGVVSTFTYSTLANAAIYTKGSPGVFPTVNVSTPRTIVTVLTQSNGIGGTVGTGYQYSGAQQDLQGRGFLGFQSVTATNQQNGLVTTTSYNLQFPYTGMMTEQKTVSGTVTLSDTVNTLSMLSPSTAGTGGHRAFPYVSQSVTTANDLNGAALPTTTATVGYDSDGSGYTYGNPASVTTATSGGFSTQTSNTYSQNLSKWILGELTQSVVTKTSP